MILFCLTAAQIAVMITNGRSDDQVDAAAEAVADGGISLFAVGECGSGDAAVSLLLLLLLPTYHKWSFFSIWALTAYLHRLRLDIRLPYI